MPDNGFLALGALLFVAAAAAHYAAFTRTLGARVTSAGLERTLLLRWLLAVAAIQGLVIVLAAGYVAYCANAHLRGYSWIAPPAGALFGTAAALQVAVLALMRSARG